jgi:hypothetical protein
MDSVPDHIRSAAAGGPDEGTRTAEMNENAKLYQ